MSTTLSTHITPIHIDSSDQDEETLVAVHHSHLAPQQFVQPLAPETRVHPRPEGAKVFSYLGRLAGGDHRVFEVEEPAPTPEPTPIPAPVPEPPIDTAPELPAPPKVMALPISPSPANPFIIPAASELPAEKTSKLKSFFGGGSGSGKNDDDNSFSSNIAETPIPEPPKEDKEPKSGHRGLKGAIAALAIAILLLGTGLVVFVNNRNAQQERKLAEAEQRLKDKVTTKDIKVENLEANIANINEGTFKNLTVTNNTTLNQVTANSAKLDSAEINNLQVNGATINGDTSIAGSTNIGGVLNASEANITNLNSTNGNITNLTTNSTNSGTTTTTNLNATNANIQNATIGNQTVTGSSNTGGQAVFTGVPTGSGVSQGSVYINPGSANPTDTLLGLAVDGVEKFRVDANGDIYGGNLSVGGLIIGGNQTVTGNLVVQGTSDLQGAVTLGSTLDVTGAATFDGTVTVGTLGSGGTTLLCSNAGQIGTCASGAGSTNFILNGTSPQTADFNITGSGVIGGTLGVTGTTTLGVLNAGVMTGTSLSLSQNNATALQLTGSSAGLTIGGDTNLFRGATDTLATDDRLLIRRQANNDIWLQGAITGQAQEQFVVQSSATGPIIKFGDGSTPPDTNLYRSAVDTLKTDDRLHVTVGLNLLSDAGTDSSGIVFGSTGSANLYRSAADTLRTDDSFLIQRTSTSAFQIQNASAQTLFVANTTAQQVAIGPAAVPANGVLTIGTDTTASTGGIYFGTDTSLYRTGGSTLFTNGDFNAGARLTARNGSGATRVIIGESVGGSAGILFSSDVNLYKGGADILKTDDSFVVGTTLTVNGSSTSLTGTNDSTYLTQIYNQSANAAGKGLSIRVDQNSATNILFNVQTGANAGNRLQVLGNGEVTLGSSTAGTLKLLNDAATNASGIIFGSTGTANLYRSAADVLTTDDSFIVAGTLSSPGANSDSEHFGAGSTVGAVRTVAVGQGASASADGAIALGRGSVSSGGSSIAIGRQASAAHDRSIVLGAFGASTTTGQLVVGSEQASMTNAYFGEGVTSTTPTANFTIQATGGSGTDIAGTSLNIAGGRGTGAGAGGGVNLQIAPPGSAGATQNALVTVLSLSGTNGAALFKNTADSTTAFQIQNSGSTPLLVADTTGMTITVTNLTVSSTLTVTGAAVFNGPTISFSTNVRGIGLAIANAATSVGVTFGTPHANANYAVQCTPSYNSTCYVTAKTTGGFTINFGTATPDGSQTVDWFVMR